MISGTNPAIILKRFIAYVFTLLVMTTIFIFSAQPAKKSDATSKSITKKIVNIITKNKNISRKKKNDIIKKWDKYIRKATHFSLYLLLGISVFISTTLTFIKKGSHYILKNAVFSFSLCVLYAITDEIHQLFVPGRSGELLDILIDSSGSLCGILILCLATYLIRKKAVA